MRWFSGGSLIICLFTKSDFMQLKNYLIALVFLFSFSLQAQIFFTEDFSGGIPAGWTNVDLTSTAGQEVTFVSTTDPNAVAPAALGNAATAFFGAAGADNGYVWANSDRGLPSAPATNHQTELTTTAIDCSASDAVFFSMESLIGVFDLDASANAILRVSTDQTNWTTFTLFPNLTTAVRWSDNPQTVSANITSVAANQTTVYLQIQWIGGWEYFWALDDIQLSSEDPRPANELRVNSFAAIAPNVSTPASQVEPIGFIADIENIGSASQASVTLTVDIVDEAGTSVFNSVLDYGTIASDSLAENVFFAEEFTPPAFAQQYIATYMLSYDNIADEATPDDNTYSFPIIITDSLFAKENGPTRSVAPAADDSYTYGNVFHINSDMTLAGEPLNARTISFGVANADELAGRFVTILLLEWPEDTDGSFTAQQDEYFISGFNSYEFTGNEGDGLITVLANEDGPVALNEGSYYIAAIQYSTEDDQAMFLQASEDYEYQAMTFYTDSLDRIRYSAALDVSNEGELSMTGFGQDIVPVVRMSVGNDMVTNTNEVELPTGAVTVFPNPANTYVNLDFDLEEQTSGRLVVFNTKGQVIINRTLDNVMSERIQLETAGLPSGTYLIRVDTELGVSNRMITVQH